MMHVPKTYHHCISVIESILGLSATPLRIKGTYSIKGCRAYLLCHPQLPNSEEKKIAVHFTDEDGDGFDVYNYTQELEYTNIEGQYPQSMGPALIKNIETIYPDVEEMIKLTDSLHNENKSQPLSN